MARLGDAQLDGRACIRCGADDQVMRAIEMHGDKIRFVECIDLEFCIDRRLARPSLSRTSGLAPASSTRGPVGHRSSGGSAECECIRENVA
jgi:hypothetical protein